MPFVDLEKRRVYHRAYQKKWQAAHPERTKEILKKYHDSHKRETKILDRKRYINNGGKDKGWARKLKRVYNLTPEQYYKILAEQGNVCAICQKETDRRFDVDHDHLTGKVRALLCHLCNKGLGCFRDDRFNLSKAIEYLTKYQDNI